MVRSTRAASYAEPIEDQTGGTPDRTNVGDHPSVEELQHQVATLRRENAELRESPPEQRDPRISGDNPNKANSQLHREISPPVYTSANRGLMEHINVQDQIQKEFEVIRRGLRSDTPSDLAAEAMRGVLLSPFSSHILNAEVPAKFRIPTFTSFDGRTDPIEHIHHVQQRMTLSSGNDGLMCLVFSTTLCGPALLWFKSKPPGTISTFQSLCEQFISQYIGNRKPKKTVSSLFALKQTGGESLKIFLERFNIEISSIDACDQKTAVEAFRVAMRSGSEFYRALLRKPPKDMTVLNRRAQGYIAVEDDDAQTSRPSSLITVAPPVRGHPSNTPNQPKRAAPTGQPIEKKPRTEKKETPLRTTLSQVFQETVNRGIFWNPTPMSSPIESRDRTKYCDFHKDVGHITNECRSLRNQVELLLSHGELTEYHLSGVAANHNNSLPGNSKAATSISPKIIDTIHGHARISWSRDPVIRNPPRMKVQRMMVMNGPPDGGPLAEITFHRWDMQKVQSPHEDPLVLTLVIAGSLIRRILVDTGSSANVMTLHTCEQLGFTDDHLQQLYNPLVGFDGTRVTPVGTIVLPIEAASRTLLEVFVVISVPSPYNVILGRGWIHRMQGVPSTLHQMMKCLSIDGQSTINILGDQSSARRCYALALKGTEPSESGSTPGTFLQ